MRRPAGFLPLPHGRAGDPAFVRRLLIESIRQSKLTRVQIAKGMTAKLRRCGVTERMLMAFTASSKDLHRWPAEFDIAFCEVLGDYRLLRELVKRAGFRMIGPEEEKLIALGAAVIAKAKAEAVIAQAVQL